MITAILSSPTKFSEIQTAVNRMGDELGFQRIDNALSITDEIQRVLQIKPARLILDLAAFKHCSEKELLKEIKRLRMVSDRTLVYVVAPGYKRGDALLHGLFTLGIYNILTPTLDDEPGQLTESLCNIFEVPMTFNQAVKFFIENMPEQEPGPATKSIQVKVADVASSPKSVLVHSKTVAIVNATPYAGSSFLTMCLAKFLTENDLPVAVLEPPHSSPYLYSYMRLDVAFDRDGFVSIPHLIASGNDTTRYDEQYSEGISWVVGNKGLTLEALEKWGHKECMAMNRFSKSSAIKIWDVGSHYNLSGLKDFMSEVDLVIAVIDPMPANVITNIDQLKRLAEMKRKGMNVEFVINRYLDDLSVDAIEQILDFCVLGVVEYVDPSEIFKLAAGKKNSRIPLNSSEIKSELEESLGKIARSFIPDGVFKSAEKASQRKGFLGLFKKG